MEQKAISIDHQSRCHSSEVLKIRANWLNSMNNPCLISFKIDKYWVFNLLDLNKNGRPTKANVFIELNKNC